MNQSIKSHSFDRLFLIRITIALLSILILICYTAFPIYAQVSAEEYINSGNEKADAGDYQEAIKDYNKAIELNPKDAEAYYNRGLAKVKLGDYRGAIEDFNKAIEINPKIAEAYNNRGVAKGDLGDYRGEIEDYNKAIEINPKHTKSSIAPL